MYHHKTWGIYLGQFDYDLQFGNNDVLGCIGSRGFETIPLEHTLHSGSHVEWIRVWLHFKTFL